MAYQETPPFKLDFEDKTLFGNDAGEDEEQEVLASYFVDQHAFRPFLDRETKLQIARSRKGMEKAALLSKLDHDLKGEDVLVVRLTGSQLATAIIPEFSNLLEAQNYWISQICTRVNATLGAAIGFAFTDTQISLVESAEITGLKEKNLIGSLISRIRVRNFPVEVIAPSHYKENSEAFAKAGIRKSRVSDGLAAC